MINLGFYSHINIDWRTYGHSNIIKLKYSCKTFLTPTEMTKNISICVMKESGMCSE